MLIAIYCLIALSLIPLFSLLNHLGGQSTAIPCPRFYCRMIGTGVTFGLISFACGFPLREAEINGAIGLGGMIFWAVWSNGAEFMSINKMDYRKYNTPWFEPNFYITRLCDLILNVNPLTKLTQEQCISWGTLYGTILGLFLYPMFVMLGIYVTPWAFAIGLFCLAQGEAYHVCGTVLKTEYVWGAFIGLALALVLIVRIAAF